MACLVAVGLGLTWLAIQQGWLSSENIAEFGSQFALVGAQGFITDVNLDYFNPDASVMGGHEIRGTITSKTNICTITMEFEGQPADE